jgi:CSLREA domain-containing protein
MKSQDKSATRLPKFFLILVCLPCSLFAAAYALSLTRGVGAQSSQRTGAPAERATSRSDAAAVRATAQGKAPSPYRAGQPTPTRYAGADAARQALLSGQARPTALTVGDYDEDGVADLVGVYAAHGGGILVLWRGDEAALFPNGAEARRRRASGESPDSPFQVTATAFELAEAPDFVGAGDFDADGHCDVVIAKAGGDALYILKGDGRGGVSQTERLALPGSVTALAVGEFNRADGLAEIAAGVVGADGAQALLFGSPEGASRARAEVLSLPAPARDLALGQLDEDAGVDLAVAAGNAVQIISGYSGLRTSAAQEQQSGAGRRRVSQHLFASEVRSLAVGDFGGDARADLAVLTDEGDVRVLWREVPKKRRGTGAKAGNDVVGKQAAAVTWRADKAVGVSSNARRLIAAHGTSRRDSLLAVGGDGRQVQVVEGEASAEGESDAAAASAQADGEGQTAAPPRMSVSASLDSDGGGAAAVLPMRLNGDAVDDLVILKEDAGEPVLLMSSPSNVFAVNSTGDASDSNLADNVCDDGTSNCTLRAAIQQANASPGADFIGFDLPTAPVNTISPASQLPNITEAVTIDATTQIDGLVVLNGSAAPANADGLRVSGGGSRVTGLVINGFGDEGIELLSGNNIVDHNRIGTDPGGLAPGPGNGGDGVSMLAVSGNLVGGTLPAARNLISANGASGVLINGAPASANLVQGNFIGTDISGTVGLGNVGRGVHINGGANNTVGGTSANARNIISTNGGYGVLINSGANTCVVQGNYVGTDASGNAALGNGAGGVAVSGAGGHTIGGTSAGARNVISGNAQNGVQIDFGSDGTQVQGNYIGTNAAGTADLGNALSGVRVDSSQNTLVGGTNASARNVISGNNQHGILLINDATGVQIQGNHIGTDANGSSDLGNSDRGIHASSSSGGSLIGGTDPAARNVISGNDVSGVELTGGTGNIVQGNYIGADATGTAALPNSDLGLVINGSANNTVGGGAPGAGNVISANGGFGGLSIFNATGNVVQGNRIGTDASGTADLGNAGDGVFVSASNNTIGGTAPGERNIISGNGVSGVFIQGGSSDNQVLGNYIGTDASGTADLGNSLNGVSINGANNTVGGAAAGAGNLISGNDDKGVSIVGTGNTVQGNLIGTDASGAGDLGNAQDGVFIGSSGNTVGGTSVGARNVISGNDNHGVFLFGGGASGNLIQGNLVGTDVTGSVALGNAQNGVHLNNASNNTVGGATAAARNVISGNTQHGVHLFMGSSNNTVQGNYIGLDASGSAALGNNVGIIIDGGGGTGNLLRGNNISDNSGLGIDLNGDGVTPNDAGDGDAGANNLQNFPVLNNATHSGGNTVIDGTLNSAPNTQFTLEFFNGGQCDPSGHGEGKVTMGTILVTTDGGGNVGFNATFPGLIALGQFITATATDPAGNTSEFSQCRQVISPNYLVNSTGDGADSNVGDFVCNDGFGNCTLRAAIQQSNNDGLASTINFAPGLSGQTIQPASQLPGLSEGNTTINSDINNDCAPDVELDGALAGGNSNGLQIFSANNTVRGLLVNRFNGDGITIRGVGASGNTVTCNHIGTDSTGTVNRGNGHSGVNVDGGAHDNQVGPNNRIASNLGDGLNLVDGAVAAYPTFTGLTPDFTGQFPSVNFPGTSGAFRHANGFTPIDGNNRPFTDNFGARFTGTLNVSTGGNYTFTVTNPDDQVRIIVDGNEILSVNCCSTTSTTVNLSAMGHPIEVDYFDGPGAARLDLAINGPGPVSFSNGPQSGLFSEFFQLRVPSERNRITHNSIYQNGSLGINLDALEGNFGVNLNDPGDNDVGPNTALNQPVVNRVNNNGGGSFTVQGTAPPDSTIEIFGTTNDDPSGYGEGRQFITSVPASSGQDGFFSATFNAPPGFSHVTATATDSQGNTSEFARNVALAQTRWGNNHIFGGPGIPNISGPIGYVTGDLNGDGRLDLIAAGQHNTPPNPCRLLIELQDGSGQFPTVNQEPMGAGEGLCNNTQESLAIGDVDADGDLDFVAQGTDNTSTGRLLLFKNDGSGTFTQQPDILSPGIVNGAVALGDVNGDGRLDLAVSGHDNATSRFAILTNNGSGLFTVSQQPLGAADGLAHGSIAFNDREKDGDLDLVVSGQNNSGVNRLSSLTNNGGTLTVTLEILPPGFTPRAKQLRFADLDLDGDLDLLWTAVLNAGSATESQLYRTTNSGGSYGGPPPQLIHTELSGGGPPAGLAVGDANGDGFPDAFMVGTFSSLTYFQGGPGGMTLAEQPQSNFIGPVVFGDFDGDNDLDLATLPPNDGLYVNQLGPANAAPSAPTGLNVVIGTPNTELRWSNSADAESPFVSLNYEVRLGTASGVYNIISGVYGTPLLGTQPLSRVATTVAGRRLALGPGTYFWQVRAIDTGLRASAWSAENSFSIQPSLSINNVSVVEGNAGTTTANFNVTLTNGGGPVTVDFATSNGNAAAFSDYVAASGTLSLSPATPTQPVSVTVNGDTLGEPNENFFVNLSNASGAVLTVSRGQATILNDEPAPTVSVGDSSTPEGNSGTRSAFFTVYLSSATHQNVTVNYDVADGSATTAGNDYVDTAGPITIPAGQTSATVAVTLNGDTTPEPDENFFVNLSSPVNASAGDMQGVGTIRNDENNPPPASLATSWTLAQEGIAGINAAATNGSLYVVAGNSGDIWTSTNTISWTKRTNPDTTSRAIVGLTFGGGQFVAVGQSPTADGGTLILTSPDGVTWTQRSTAPLTRNLRGVAFGGGVYVAASNNGRVLTSPDGITWTERNTGNLQRLNGVAFGGGLFVAVGDNRTVITSSDGINWTVRGGIPAVARQLNYVTHTGTQFVVVSQEPSGVPASGASVMTSPDGVMWTQRATPTAQPLTAVASGGGVIVAVGVAADANGTFLSSTDGVTWTARAATEPGPGVARSFGRALTYGPAGFVAGTGRGTVYASPDGTTNWQSRTLAASRTLQSVAHNGSTFCAVGVNGAIYSSPDGATWTARSGPDYIAYFFWGSVKYAGGQFVAVGLSDSVMTSSDCVNWTVRNPAAPLVPFAPANGSLEDVAYGGGLFVAVGDIVISPTQTEVRILTSPDGVNWTPRNSGVPPTFIQGYNAGAVAYGNGTFVAHFTDFVTGEFIIITSPDGVTWTRQSTASFDSFRFESFGDILHAGGMFVGVGDRIWTSPDGVTWTLRLDDSDTFFLGVAYDGGRFVAVGLNGSIYASQDGIDWAPQAGATRHTLNAVVAGGTRFVAVGESAIEYADFGPLNFVVNSAADTDDGVCDAADCTLREAINASNAQGGVNTIAFQIAGAGVHTIAPTSELPTVTDPVIIDGTTQPGFAGSPLIELNGAGAGAASDGLTVASGGSTVRGLVINRFDGSGIRLQTGGGNVVTGNYVGTNAVGTADLGNNQSGVMIDNSPNNSVGGLVPSARNLLSGNNQHGVLLNGAGSSGNTVQGNYVGTDVTGTNDLGNTLDGINVLGAPNNNVGGTAAGAGNLASGNDRHGVGLSGATGTNVRGNLIGTNAAATARVKNTSDGVFLSGGNANTIGGSVAGTANVISGNGLHGVEFSASSNNTVQGNFIGTNASGSSSIFNDGRGVYIQGGGSNNNAIGGTAAGQGNTIAFNLMQGVYVGSGVGNAIRGNSIHSNQLLGIDLGTVGVTANDSKDKDTGANNLQNFPVISSASAGTQRVMGSLGSLVQTQFTIQFFASPTCDASGNGEGMTPIGTTTVTTSNSGSASFNVVVPLVAGQRVTATATDPAGNTSEFSPCFTVGP